MLPVEEERVLLGRHPNCQIVFDNGAVSRHHAQVLESHGSYYIEDLRSRNGTYLNGEPLDGRTELSDGDQIRICDIQLLFMQRGPLDESTRDSDEEMQANETAMGSDFPRGPERTTASGSSIDESRIWVVADQVDEPEFESSSVIKRIDTRGPEAYSAAVHPEIKLKAVLEITRALSGELDVDAVLPKVLSTLFNIFPEAEQGFVLLKDPESDKLRVKATRLRAGNEDDAVAVSMTVVRHVLNSGEAILSGNIQKDSRFKKSTSLSKMQIRSMMCVPLLGKDGDGLGVIQIVTRQPDHEFREDDLDLLVSVGSQAGLAIDNAYLHEEVIHQRDLERDLEFATQVQLGFLPKSRPRLPHYAFADYYEAALRVGGDYFDYVTLPGGRTAIALGDVAGKGVPAALLMARLYSSTRFQLLTNPNLAEAVAGLNAEIASSGLGHRFVTFVVLVLDPETHELTIVNAGHLAPLIRRADGTVDQLGRDESSLPLGIIPDLEYTEVTVPIDFQETVLLYTDGITEAMSDDRAIYGRERLMECLGNASGGIESVVKTLITDVEQFVGDSPFRDDTCVVGFQRTSG
ncbi:Transcriptional regulatory protein EmbR [Maioricimonas rarisocia]|uniref:Transcriptional regulatory protein EmbR n=2 Tax=Maioricimonas rarisocia TaxID=2528026 RepID=A0A517ZET9_9PLAN|nr:Transcriptional regulatory protein EmbR [Maioricimonas rarisocia]